MHESATPLPQPASGLDSKTRWTIYWLLIVCSVAIMAGRLWQVRKISYDRPVPFLSANDRSRWCTIRSLGDHDTYAIDFVLQSPDGRSWDTIDKVMHWGRDGRPHFYSSKPTLLPTILAWPYLGLQRLTGWTLEDDPFQVVRWLLLAGQVLPLVIFFWATGRIADQVANSDWTRIFLVACATFGTFITTFAITLNNHVPTVVCVSLATLLLIRIWRRDATGRAAFVLTGLMAALAAAFELPATAFLALAGFLCLLRNPLHTLTGFVPAAALIAAAFFATNHTAHNDWRPAYAHRSDGPVLDSLAGDFQTQLERRELPDDVAAAIQSLRNDLPPDWRDTVQIMPGGWPTDSTASHRWIVYFQSRYEPLVLAIPDSGDQLDIRRWDNWYEYPGSYWLAGNDTKSAVDRGEPDPLRYLVNLTVWHHGVFLLTPVWWLSVVGVGLLCVSAKYRLRWLGMGIVAISIVVIAFYVTRPVEDRNYGGLCSAPRWLFWLAPLWLVAMIPALDAIADRRGLRWLAVALLAISIASACYAWANPWVHPWLYQWLQLP